MVGVAILKDFETGSYERIRLTFFEGHSFEDIDRGRDFVSCVVNPVTRKIVFDHGDLRRKPTAKEIFDVCRHVRELWMENEYATIVRFTQNYGDIKLRLVSEKLGVYGIPDKYSLFGRKHIDVSELVCDVRDRDILYISALCEALNFGVESLFNVNYPMFFYASGGIYVNVFLCESCLGERFALPKELVGLRRHATKYYRSIIKKRKINFAKQAESSPHPETAYDIIRQFRYYKCAVMKYVLEKGLASKEFILQLPQDSHIEELTSVFYMSACDFLEGLEGYFSAPSHVRYITVNDMLVLVSASSYRERIARKARAASINYKFQSKLPCPTYYDSHGRAYTRRG